MLIATAAVSLAFSNPTTQIPLVQDTPQESVGFAEQDVITLPLKFEERRDSDSHGLIVLYEYDEPGKVFNEGQRHTIQPPPLAAGSTVAYGFVYFTGRPKCVLGDVIVFLVEGIDSDSPRFHVDLNGNLDLTDDGGVLLREANSNSYMIALHAEDKPKHRFPVRVGWLRNLPQYIENPDALENTAAMFQGYVQSMGGTAAATKYWLYDKRLNIRSASFKLKGTSFQIGVIDLDCNGSYADEGEDRVLVGKFGAEFLSSNRSGGATTIGTEGSLIRLDNRTYEVLEVDLAGEFIRIRPSDKPYTRLLDGSPLPKLDLLMMDGTQLEIAELLEPDTYLLLDFWGNWCVPCIETFPIMKYLEELAGDRLSILGLHHGDHEKARLLIAQHELGWLQAQASEEIVETFMVDGWPYYVLVDPNGMIHEIGMDLIDLFEFFK